MVSEKSARDEPHGRRLTGEEPEDAYDFVIIGAGSAGCVLAARLSEDPSVSVLLLEAGSATEHPDMAQPMLWQRLWKSSADWAYVTEPEPGYGGRSLEYPRGKGLGGSSAVNATLYVRGNSFDYDGWRELGNAGWSYEDVLPYFLRAECNSRGASPFRGADGPLRVSDTINPHETSLAFVNAAAELGHARNPDYNGAEQEGAGLFQVTAAAGIRQSTARAYLEPARARPNLHVMTGTHASRIRLERSVAVGVEYLLDGTKQTARAKREVVLSAGAIESPKLLMLSGIGPSAHLEALDISVTVDLPGVGHNLHDHSLTAVAFKSAPSPPVDQRSQIPEAFLFAQSRVATEGRGPDIQLHFCATLNQQAWQRTSGTMVFAVNACRPRSRGRVQLSSADPLAKPRFSFNYLADSADVALHIEGVRLCRELAATRALSGSVVAELVPGPFAQSDVELESHLRKTSEHVWHAVGSCKMGVDELAVVDPQLRVRGVAGLRVIDASVMPRITSGNTNAPTIMIAERGADFIKLDR